MRLAWALALLVLTVPVMAQPSSQIDPDPATGTGIPANPIEGGGTCPAPLQVCYYDLGLGQGNPSQVTPITVAGHTPGDVSVQPVPNS